MQVSREVSFTSPSQDTCIIHTWGNLESPNVHIQCFWSVGGNQNYLEKTHTGKGRTHKLHIELLRAEPRTFLLTKISNGDNSTSELFMCIHAQYLKWPFLKLIQLFFLMFFVNISCVIQLSFVICSCDISVIKENSSQWRIWEFTHCKDCMWMIFQSCLLMDPDWYLVCLLPICQHQIPWAWACVLADLFSLDLQQLPCVRTAAQNT